MLRKKRFPASAARTVDKDLFIGIGISEFIMGNPFDILLVALPAENPLGFLIDQLLLLHILLKSQKLAPLGGRPAPAFRSEKRSHKQQNKIQPGAQSNWSDTFAFWPLLCSSPSVFPVFRQAPPIRPCLSKIIQ